MYSLTNESLMQKAQDILPQRHKVTKNMEKQDGLIHIVFTLCVLVPLWFNLFLFDSGFAGLG